MRFHSHSDLLPHPLARSPHLCMQSDCVDVGNVHFMLFSLSCRGPNSWYQVCDVVVSWDCRVTVFVCVCVCVCVCARARTHMGIKWKIISKLLLLITQR
jgi:hypothetical protein